MCIAAGTKFRAGYATEDDNSNSDIPDSEQLESNKNFQAIFESDSEDFDFDGF